MSGPSLCADHTQVAISKHQALVDWVVGRHLRFGSDVRQVEFSRWKEHCVIHGSNVLALLNLAVYASRQRLFTDVEVYWSFWKKVHLTSYCILEIIVR